MMRRLLVEQEEDTVLLLRRHHLEKGLMQASPPALAPDSIQGHVSIASAFHQRGGQVQC